MTLDKLPLHQESTIESIQADRAVAQRLMAMGFLPGARVKTVQVAPFGDPITVELSGWRISLRHAEAALVRTEAVRTRIEHPIAVDDAARMQAATGLRQPAG